MRIVRAVTRLTVYLAIIIGLPVLLSMYGSPLPGHWPTGDDWRVLVTPPGEETIADLIVIAGWTLWAAVIAAVATRITRVSRQQPAPAAVPQQRWRVPGPVRAVTAMLLGTAATTAVAGTVSAAPATAPAATTETPPPPAEGRANRAVEHVTYYTVQSGDTLWGIADTELGDPLRWRDIYRLNKDRTQEDGDRLSDADLIRPGWQLRLPTDAATEPPPPPPDPEPESPVPPADPALTPSATTTLSPEQSPSTSPTDTATPPTSVPSVSATPSATSPTTDAPPATVDLDTPYPVTDDGGFQLPTGAWISAGLALAVAAAVRLARIRRRHRTATDHSEPPSASPPQVHAILDAAAEAPPASEPDAAGHTAEGTPATITELATTGLGLTGLGAHAAARSILATHLTRTGDATVLITDDDLAILLPTGTTAPDLPDRLMACPSAELSTRLHTELLRRARITDTGATPPPLLLITSDTRTARITTSSPDLGITTLILDEWPTATATVAADGTTTGTPATRLHHLTAGDLADILTTITDPPPVQQKSLSDPAPDPTPAETPASDTAEADDHPAAEHPPATAGIPTADHAHAEQPHAAPTPATDPPPAPEQTSAPITVNVFGPLTVNAADTPITTGLRSKARELLAYLAQAHPHGATSSTLIEELLPTSIMSKAPNHLRTIINNARTRLRTASGRATETFIHKHVDRYLLDGTVIDSDLWQFTGHLDAAANTTDPHDQITALSAAIALYTADFATGLDSDWIEPVRENLKYKAINAHSTLADLHHDNGDTTTALTVLETACELAPYDEALHQRTITRYLAADRPDRAQHILHRLERALAVIDAAPQKETLDLFPRSS